MDLSGKSVMILGDGISGRAAFEALKDIARPFFCDMEKSSKEPFATAATALNKEKQPQKTCLKPDLIVTSPGIASHPAFDYAKSNSIPCIAELELGYILNKTPVVAITGTNGKTTVTRLIGDILSKEYKTAVCGNIGVPFCAAAAGTHEIAVVEVSSFQLERTFSFNPSIAVITNISPDHLDRHGDMSAYTALKMKIAANQTEDDFLICPIELKPLLPVLKSNLIFSDIDCIIKNGEIYFMNEPVMSVSDIKIEGEHNLKNAMQSICAAKLLGIKNKNVCAAISEFKTEPHRLQLISHAKNKDWYDDSKSTNIGSCLAACRSMKGSTALILGGSDKGYEFDGLFSALPKTITHIFIMGQVKEKLSAAANKAKILAAEIENLEQAIKAAAQLEVKNVLLSPAAASFDTYKDYKHRGAEFVRLVGEL